MKHDVMLTDGELLLRPLTEQDLEPLAELAARSPQEWSLMGSAPTTVSYYLSALNAPDQFPFVIEYGGQTVGATRLGQYDPHHRSVEIGWSWLTPSQMGTGLNRRVKRLMLAYAFEALKVTRTSFRTDARNLRSQRAMENIGAVREGVLRKQHVRADGFIRDTVVYSVIDEEWPTVRAALA